MCFRKRDIDEKAQVAETDIAVFKILRKDRISPVFYGMTWKKDEVETSEIRHDAWDIEDGLHSIKTREDAVDYRYYNFGNVEEYPIFKFIIPKGANYFENYSQYVSDKLVMASDEPIDESELVEEEPVNL